MNDPQDPHASGLAYEFEVKEQDRWLPIANGMSYSLLCPLPSCLMIRVVLDTEPLAWRRGPSLTGIASGLVSASKTAAHIHRPPCLAIRRPSRRKRLALLVPHPLSLIETILTMLTSATLRQSPAS